MNSLEAIRKSLGLTYARLGKLINVQRHVAWKHCRLARVPAEAAIRYSQALDIPLAILRPDLFSPDDVL